MNFDLKIELNGNKKRMLGKHWSPFGVTKKSIEDQIRKFPYTGQGRKKDARVEYGVRLPMYAKVFYANVFFLDRIPSPEEFMESYLSQTCFSESTVEGHVTFIDERSRKYTLDKEAIIARGLRAYPSLLRDLHFYVTLVESGKFENVSYSTEKDFQGTDVTVVHNGKEYGVALFVDTARSRDFKQRKEGRHDEDYKSVICLPIDMSYGGLKAKVGDYYLYTPAHINILVNKIQAVQKTESKTA